MNGKTLAFGLLLSLLLMHKGQAESWSKQTQADIEAKRAELQQRLTEVEKRYGETAASLKLLEEQIKQARHNLGKNQHERMAYQKELDKHRKQLAAQVKSAYIMGQKEKLKILLSQQDPMLSTRMMMYYNYINKARQKELDDIQAAIKRQNQLEQQKETETQRLKQSLEQKKSEQLAFEDAKKQRSELLEQLMRDYSSRQQQLDDLKESENKLKSLLSSLQEGIKSAASEAMELFENKNESETNKTNNDSDFASLQGKLPWPVKGSVRKFGSAREKSMREGVLIKATEGTEVRAVAKGKVAYADPFQSYGSLIIIDHGQGYMTVHGFNQSLYKRVGDKVAAGDVIATVGKSGGRKHSGLYFGIRKKGVPINPLTWCVKPSK